MAELSRKAFVFGMGSAAAVASVEPAAAQFPNPSSILRGAQRRVESTARNAAEQSIARSLFPLENQAAQFYKQFPKYDRTEFGPFLPMDQLPRTPTGGFVLKPGAWTFTAQSYCLKAGTYERTGGAGYSNGPFAGKLAPTINAILEASYRHPEITQRDIQLVLWSLVAGLTYAEIPAAQKVTLNALLTPDQVRQANLATAEIPPAVSAAVLSRLPRDVRELILTRQRLRRLAAQPNASYGDMERLAVLTGVPVRLGTEIPSGRWSWHPGGYFMRCSSETYKKTQIEIVVGEPLKITRDRKGRITQWALADGRKLDLTYREDLAPVRLRAAPKHTLHFFQSIRYTFPGPRGPITTGATNKGFTFLRVPSRRRRGATFEPEIDLDFAFTATLAQCQVPESALLEGVTEDARDRMIADGIELSGSRALEVANEARERGEAIDDLSDLGTPASEIENLGDAEHMREGVTSVTIGDTSDRLGFIADFHQALARALAGANATLDGMTGTAGGGSSGAGASGVSWDVPDYEPSGNPAYPSGSGQIRGISGRPSFS